MTYNLLHFLLCFRCESPGVFMFTSHSHQNLFSWPYSKETLSISFSTGTDALSIIYHISEHIANDSEMTPSQNFFYLHTSDSALLLPISTNRLLCQQLIDFIKHSFPVCNKYMPFVINTYPDSVIFHQLIFISCTEI